MHRIAILAAGLSLAAASAHAVDGKGRYGGNPADLETHLQRLVATYPDTIQGFDKEALILKDGVRLALSDGRGDKTFQELLDSPDIGDMFAFAYPVGAKPAAPPFEFDPGRIRHAGLFRALYGDCKSGGVEKRLRRIKWVDGTSLPVTTAQGADKALERVVAALKKLPPEMQKYLSPSAGTYNCRVIAGTRRYSMHALGAAIDLNTKYSAYWQWSKPGPDGQHKWTNQIPKEIVDVFEANGFIWGGRWYHYDTMHFEYRPDLIPLRDVKPTKKAG